MMFKYKVFLEALIETHILFSYCIVSNKPFLLFLIIAPLHLKKGPSYLILF